MSDLRQRLAELPIERLVSLLSGGGFWESESITDLGIPSFVLTDGPHGRRRQPDDADHLGFGDSVPASCFPTASILAASWDPDLLAVVDRWLSSLSPDGFDAVVPLLRRTFGGFEPAERRRIMSLLLGARADRSSGFGDDVDPARADAVLVTVRHLLGLAPSGSETPEVAV